MAVAATTRTAASAEGTTAASAATAASVAASAESTAIATTVAAKGTVTAIASVAAIAAILETALRLPLTEVPANVPACVSTELAVVTTVKVVVVHTSATVAAESATIVVVTTLVSASDAVSATTADIAIVVIAASDMSGAGSSVPEASATIATVVSAIPSAAHTEVLVMAWIAGTVEIATPLIVAASVVHAPTVTATIGYVEVGTSEVEIVAVRIAGIDAEVPVACIPNQRAVEIGGCTEQIPLP